MYLEMICKLWSSCLGLNVLKASFPHARYHHDYSNPLHIRKHHVFPTYLLTWLLEITLQHENMISCEMITKYCNHFVSLYCINTVLLGRTVAVRKADGGRNRHCDVINDVPLSLYLTLMTSNVTRYGSIFHGC